MPFSIVMLESLFFFFQAEDGIRDIGVTGVQTCALPISPPPGAPPRQGPASCAATRSSTTAPEAAAGSSASSPASRRARKDRKSVVEGKRVDLGGRRIL